MEPWDDAGIEDLLASLQRWAGDQRAAEAGAARARERWLRQQAGEAATFAGILVDLGERHETVLVRTAGRTHVGRIRGVGRDVAVLESPAGALTLVALDAMQSCQVAPPATEMDWSGSRAPARRLSLAGLLAALAAERAPIQIELKGGPSVAGWVRTVGADVLSVRLEGEPARAVQIPLRAIASCAL